MYRTKSTSGVLALFAVFVLWGILLGAVSAEDSDAIVTAVIVRDMSPSCFLNTNTGKPDGFGVDLLNTLAKKAGFSVSYLVVGDWTEVEEALKNNQADLCPVIAVSDKRKEYLNFTEFTESHGITINVRSSSREIKSLTDLKGRNVAVIGSSQAFELLKDNPDIRLQEYDSFQVALLDLLAGQVDAFVAPSYIVLKLAQDAGFEDHISVLSPPLKEFKRAIGVRKEKEALYAQLRGMLPAFTSSPEYQALFVKWFGSPQPYWTAARVGKVAGAILLAIVLLMAFWRHIGMVRINRRLGESEERYRLAMDAATDGVWDWDVTTGTVQYNPAWRRIIGVEEVENEFDVWASRLHPDEKEAVLEGLQPCLNGKSEHWSQEHRLLAADGTWKWVLGRGRVVSRDAQGRPLRMIGTMTDISERKRAEAALCESREMLNLVLDTVPQSIFWKDRESRYLGCNQVFATAVGLDEPAQIIGKTDYDLPWPRKEADTYRADDREVMEKRQRKRHIIEPLQQADGTRLWIDTSKTPLLDGNGHCIGVLGVYEDISERKRIEEEREQLRDQLLQAQKMESVGRLAGGVAHDFNNMLQAILGNVELALEEHGLESPVHESLTEIQKCAQHSADLTRQLLAFARRQVVTPKVLDLNETIESMLKMLKRLIGEDIDLLWKPAAKLEPVFIDPAQIDQTLANLCVNARDAIGHHNGKVTIETGMADFDEEYCALHPGFVPGRYIRLSVSDDGCGMDEPTRTNIFEPFFTTKNVGKGTGLGLATVYGVVKQNEGFINVYSKPGYGTSFHIYLPCHSALPPQVCQRSEEASPSRGSETILLVEDEPAILSMTVMMLERKGYTVLGALTPGEAMRLAREHPGKIHLLMTDVVMPEMNGRDLARDLLALCPNLKCLFMSGYTADVIAHHGVLDSGIHFIQKPFSARDLASKLREVLDEV
jgi:PAS domain S-box-containing protein